MVIIDPTVNLSDTDGITQRVRAALTRHPPDNGATYHTMDRGTADVISRMLIDGAPAPAWVWDCLDPNDGCNNRICRLAHLMKQAQAAKAAPPAPPIRLERHICNADDCCTAEERDRACATAHSGRSHSQGNGPSHAGGQAQTDDVGSVS